MPQTILVVDDEPDVVEVLRHALTKEGFHVEAAFDGKGALEGVRRLHPDLVLLDWMLPEASGADVLKLLRAAEATALVPVILLTARRDEIDRVLAFELGADDYVTKPFSPREVVLRTRAVLRRRSAPAGPESARTLRVGPIRLDLETYRTWVADEPLALTITEFRLLADLVQAQGRVRTRDRLLSEVWGYDSEVLSRTVDTHVRRLREKLGTGAAWLETVRGVGYRVCEPHPS